jgi:hypothetical protein
MLFIVFALGLTGEVRAQSSQVVNIAYVNVSVGIQPQHRDFDAASSFTVYDETATLLASEHIGSGPLFDINGGFRLARNVLIGVGFSSFGDKHDGTIVASVPHPIFFNQQKTVVATVADLEHSERAVYVQFVYFVPLSEKIDLAFGIGPTFIHASQDVISSFNVPAGTQDVNPVTESQSKTGVGVIVGFDGTYMFTRRYGAGLFVRYNGASVDLPLVPDLSVGGFQAGVGIRVRF